MNTYSSAHQLQGSEHTVPALGPSWAQAGGLEASSGGARCHRTWGSHADSSLGSLALLSQEHPTPQGTCTTREKEARAFQHQTASSPSLPAPGPPPFYLYAPRFLLQFCTQAGPGQGPDPLHTSGFLAAGALLGDSSRGWQNQGWLPESGLSVLALTRPAHQPASKKTGYRVSDHSIFPALG